MANGNDLSATNLKKVQDLLFGEQQRDVDKRFAGMEDQVSKDVQRLRADLLKRLETLEQFTKKEVDGLGRRLKDGGAEADAASKDLGQRLATLSKAFDKRMTETTAEQAKALEALRAELAAEGDALREEFSERTEELGEELGAELDEVRDAKLDRGALADLLTEIAAKLRGKKAK